MIGYLEALNNQIKETTSEFTKKLKTSEQNLNKKDLSNKETLIMIFEEMESLKLRVKKLEDAAGITFTAPAKKDDLGDEMLSEDLEDGDHL